MEEPELLFEMVIIYLSLFEVYDTVQMKEFLRKNNDSHFCSQFLDMLRCFIINSKKEKMLSKDQASSILATTFDRIF